MHFFPQDKLVIATVVLVLSFILFLEVLNSSFSSP